VQARTNHKRLRAEAQKLLNSHARGRRYHLKVEVIQPEGSWTYVVVAPERTGMRAYDYVDALNDVEDELRKRKYTNVILLPAIPD
jgi:hypothetical protein